MKINPLFVIGLILISGLSVSAHAQTTGSSAPRISVDRPTISQLDMFSVSVTGLPSKYITDGSILRFSRAGVPATSCEHESRADLCQIGTGVTCGVLPVYGTKTSTGYFNANLFNADANGKMEFICYMNGNNGASSANQTYSVKVVARPQIPFTGSQLTPSIVSSNKASFVVNKNGTPSVGMSNYNSCREGQGMDPFQINKGCIDCQYLREGWRDNISTCQNIKEEVYKWWSSPRTTVLDKTPQCGGTPVVGDICAKGTPRCAVGPKVGDMTFSCTKGGEHPADTTQINGKVVDEAGNPLEGVKVQLVYTAFGYRDLGVTKRDGLYENNFVEMGLSPHIAFSKSGYISDSFFAKPGTQDPFVLRRQTVSGKTQIGIEPTAQTLDMNSNSVATIRVSNVEVNDLEACVEVLVHPSSPSSVSTGNCTTGSNYVVFNQDLDTKNDDWKFDGTSLVGSFSKDTAYLNADGIVVKNFFRKKSDPTTVVSSTLTITKKADVGTTVVIGGVNVETEIFALQKRLVLLESLLQLLEELARTRGPQM